MSLSPFLPEDSWKNKHREESIIRLQHMQAAANAKKVNDAVRSIFKNLNTNGKQGS